MSDDARATGVSRRCEGCGTSDARLRRCSAEVLCATCRSSDAFRLATRRRAVEVLRTLADDASDAPDVADDEWECLATCRSYSAPNPRNPAFARVRLYREADVRAAAAERAKKKCLPASGPLVVRLV